MNSYLAELQDVSVRIGGKQILHDASIYVKPGEVLAIVGPNGAGKSTLLKVLAGVLAHETGRVVLNGQDDLSRQDRAEAVAYLPQEFRPHWDYKVADLVAMGRYRGSSLFGYQKSPDGNAPQRLDDCIDVMEMFDLAELKHRNVKTLSGGERARAGLAWALAGGAAILAADEPIAALDPSHQLHTLSAFQTLRQHLSTVVVLHDINLAARFADRIAVVSAGRVVACGSAEEITSGTVLEDVFKVHFGRMQAEDGLVLWPKVG